MTDLGNYPDGGLLPELPADGLVLWRLRSYDDQWWCTVEHFADLLALRVHTPDNERTALSESYETSAAVVARADELRAQYLGQGWELDDRAPVPTEREKKPLLVTVWLAPHSWKVTRFQYRADASGAAASPVGDQRPLGQLLAPEAAEVVFDVLDAALDGSPQTLFFKAVRDSGVRWRRGLIYNENEQMRMDIYEAAEAEVGAHAIEVDLRASL